ncbi:MAG: FAD-dependent oxidoreductase [Ectothiorhodospiraceae bacterium]|nr:FAD-dependent oxidoreductase [Ectothiorhodospiraceae bacterium]
MKSHARVVVVGGGVVGVSTLYHLTKKGWSDVVLVEKSELTHGSTWHAAGLLPLFNMSYSVGQIHKYSVDLYKRLEAETGQDVSFHVTGNLRLATNRERMDEYLKYCGTANTIGVPFEVITPKEVKALWPLCNVRGLVGALYHPQDGHIAPADLTQALAIGARRGGAEIYRQTAVLGIERTRSGEWLVRTSGGDVTCEHVVTATGSWARQTAAMVGLDLPVIAVEHQYIVTDAVPELEARHRAGKPEMAVLRESDASYYLREERQGYILGPYEKGAPAWAVDGVPADFGQELLAGDLERLMPHVEAASRRVPSFANARVKDIVNGPIPYTPDGSPIIGPAPGLRNFWWNEGHSFGITAAGGSGWQLAEWIVEGEPGIDMNDVHPCRFGAYANKAYTRRKNEEAYEHVFVIHYPDEERPACRPAKTSPIHDKLDRHRAVWGQRFGWERPNWFAPKGVARRDHWSFRRSRYFEHVGNEHRALRERVGLIDITSFSKFELSGPGAQTMLDRLVANRLPARVGRIALAHALTRKGGVRSEFTITRDGPDRFYLVSSGAAEAHDRELLEANLPTDGSVRLDVVTGRHGVLVLAGPRARDVLASLTDADLSNAAFPWLTARHITVGLAPVRAMRVNFVGDLGWELHHPIEYQHHLFDALMEAGRPHGLALVGMRAMDSLRIEKSYRMWRQDLTPDYTPLESGMERFVRLDKGDFVGRDALLRQRDTGVPNRFVTLACDVDDADAIGNEPLWQGDRAVGRATAGAYGFTVGRSLALGYVRPEAAAIGTRLEIEILGERYPAEIVPESPYDPDNASLRA